MEDRISGLPDDILVCILTFLSTLEAVRTSLLSKRWKRIWASVPVLDFDDHDYYEKKRIDVFRNMVDRVLLLHDLPSLYSLSLSCSDESPINAWISTALKRNVQKVHLNLKSSVLIIFPGSFFLSDTLTILKIGSLHPQVEIKIPTAVCLPILKLLHLERLLIYTHQSSKQVSFTVPMLQEFSLICCEWYGIETVEIVAPTLEELTFYDFYCENDVCNIKVFAESLQSLELISDLTNHLTLCSLSILAMAIIHVLQYSDDDHKFIYDIFRAISNVKHLTISDFSLKFLSQAENLSLLPNFFNLTHFKVDIGRDCYFDEDRYEISSKQFTDVLCLLPSVKYLDFHNDPWQCALADSAEGLNNVEPQDCLSHLKLIKLKHFHGSKNELLLVKDLLRDAAMLEKTIIISSTRLINDSNRHKKVAQKLQMLPKGSQCVVCFS